MERKSIMNRSWMVAMTCLAALAWGNSDGQAIAEVPMVYAGDPVPRDIRDLYEAGCRYVARTQEPSGSWKDQQGGPGVTGMALMVLLASGEDPNHGAYASQVRKAVRSIIAAQNATTGCFDGQTMYHHGFAMLALAEAYGVVDERELGDGQSIGKALELAVKAAVVSAKANPNGAWRYSPDSKDADTSVSGAVMMGLLGARNAGIEVPDETIDKAITYFTGCTAPNGQVGYMGAQGGSAATNAIGTLVLAIARRKDVPQYGQAAALLTQTCLNPQQQQAGMMMGHGGGAYAHYYQAQALLQADVATWQKWNERLVQELKAKKAADGSFTSPQGSAFHDTCLSLLAVACNFRFLPIYER